MLILQRRKRTHCKHTGRLHHIMRSTTQPRIAQQSTSQPAFARMPPPPNRVTFARSHYVAAWRRRRAYFEAHSVHHIPLCDMHTHIAYTCHGKTWNCFVTWSWRVKPADSERNSSRLRQRGVCVPYEVVCLRRVRKCGEKCGRSASCSWCCIESVM